jgi:hypothetical protein
MKYKIKSFIVGVKEARRILCTTVEGRPARRAYDMGLFELASVFVRLDHIAS